MIRLSEGQLRNSTLLLAVGTVAFSLWPLLWPKGFCATFEVPLGPEEGAVVPIRSVAARDVVSAIGLISAATHGGRVAPWLLGRLLSDATDVIWVALAFARGARSARLALLGVIAFGAVVADVVLYRGYKSGAG